MENAYLLMSQKNPLTRQPSIVPNPSKPLSALYGGNLGRPPMTDVQSFNAVDRIQRQDAYNSTKYIPWPSDSARSGIQVLPRAALQFTPANGKIYLRKQIDRAGLVVFFMRSCFHCHKLADVTTWEQTGQKLGTLFDLDAYNYGQVPILLVDGQAMWADPATGQIDSNANLLKALGVDSFPTIFGLHSDGSLQRPSYEGSRSLQALNNLITAL